MKTNVEKLKPSLDEVQKGAHSQSLIEVPRRAQLDRTAERHKIFQGIHESIIEEVEEGV